MKTSETQVYFRVYRAAAELLYQLRMGNPLLLERDLRAGLHLCLGQHASDEEKAAADEAVDVVIDYPHEHFVDWNNGSAVSTLMWDSAITLEKGLALCVL